MTEKVTVTEKQANWLNRYEGDGEKNHAINIQSYILRPDSPIADWTPAKVAKALYIGYEVEPEFKVGDWVVVSGEVGELTKKYKGHSRNGDFCLDEGQIRPCVKDIERHATPDEIAQEKERRFWHRNGREVKQYKTGDVVSHCEGVSVLSSVEGELFKTKDVGALHPCEMRVACFNHERKDVCFKGVIY